VHPQSIGHDDGLFSFLFPLYTFSSEECFQFDARRHSLNWGAFSSAEGVVPMVFMKSLFMVSAHAARTCVPPPVLKCFFVGPFYSVFPPPSSLDFLTLNRQDPLSPLSLYQWFPSGIAECPPPHSDLSSLPTPSPLFLVIYWLSPHGSPLRLHYLVFSSLPVGIIPVLRPPHNKPPILFPCYLPSVSPASVCFFDFLFSPFPGVLIAVGPSLFHLQIR